MVQQASIRRSNAPIRIGVLLLITLDRAVAQTTVGAACTRRQKAVFADLSMRPRCASMLMATLEHLAVAIYGIITVRRSAWLIVAADASTVGVDIESDA